MIDSSPMYGSSQAVVGRGLEKLGRPQALFSAEKVWTSSGANGHAQIEQSRRFWGVQSFDLLQVHNLLAWEAHLDTLQAMKAAGRLRYVGITTSEGRRHDLVEEIMRRHPLDFVQLTYNPVDREAEQRLLPLAGERGIAVIVNRPFQQGALTRRLDGEPLPGWAGEAGATSWAQLILKFILSHPTVTVAIPATTQVGHVRENLAAAGGALPDRQLRERIAAHIGGV
jgi:diketogulonate reductase-like aldo/keto reductase